ncbi:MAG: DUF2490 domain-containing protein [Chitinophagaceae bacterium]|nr:MAG: DUF2490 domain-containing protein [Chitinophagaceae bacterium]
MRRLFLFFSFVSISIAINAQPQFSGWLASFNTFRINNKLSLHFDAQLRSTDEIKSVQSILLRPGLNVHISKSWVLTAGYAYIANRRTVGVITDLLPEHRIWQQALFNQKINRIALAHRFRFEERFISKTVVEDNELETDGFNQAFRFRYFIRGIVPLVIQSSFVKGPFFAVQNEIFLNTGNKTTVNGKTFDQNRLYGALGYRLQGKLDIEAGYMNQYTSTAASFINNHIVQIALYKRL